MSQGTATAANGATTAGGKPDLVEAAKSLIPLVDRHAAESEALGALVPEIDEAFHETGLWGMWVPEVLGGAELGPVASVEVLEHISYGDASAGWVLMAAAIATGCDAAYIGDDAAEQMYPGTGRLLVHEGQGTRAGRGVTTDGGYLLSGEWAFASGIKHAKIIHTGMQVQETGEVRVAVLPIEQATLIDNWDVLGLRATGSIDYTIDSAFVPESYTYNATTNKPLRGGSLYTLGIINLGMICHASWALGVGHRMLDELKQLVVSRSGRPGGLGENVGFLGEYAMAEAKWRATRALIYETWNDCEETLRRGDELSLDQNTTTRLVLQHTTWAMEEVCRWVYHAAGTAALREGTLQRFFRDMHGGTAHMTSSLPIRQTVGRMLLGQAPGKTWQFLSLIDDPAA